MSIDRVCEEDVADQLLSLIRPYYKGLRGPGEAPEFKKSMRGDEVEQLLLSLHGIVVCLKKAENNGGD